MVKVAKDGKVLELATDLQASVFVRNGWKVVEDEPVAPFMNKPEVSEPEKTEEIKDVPKKRGRKVK